MQAPEQQNCPGHGVALSTAISTCRVANPPLRHKSFQPAEFKNQKRIILKLKQGGGGNGGRGQVV